LVFLAFKNFPKNKIKKIQTLDFLSLKTTFYLSEEQFCYQRNEVILICGKKLEWKAGC
jgi:hypothetical protein